MDGEREGGKEAGGREGRRGREGLGGGSVPVPPRLQADHTNLHIVETYIL